MLGDTRVVIADRIKVHKNRCEKGNDGGAWFVSGTIDMGMNALAREVTVNKDMVWGMAGGENGGGEEKVEKRS